jgi:flavorubredoxin
MTIPQQGQPARPTPQRIAADTWLIPHLVPAGPGAFLPINSMLIRGAEPVIVDTGAPIHRATWFEQAFSLVEPEDVRWVFLSHDDSDHMGNLDEVLELCPNATLVVNFFINERVSAERTLPLHRMRWIEPGEALDAGDRRLHAVLPPVFDAPTTRGLYDERTGVLWAVDAFAALTPGAVHHAQDLPPEMYVESFRTLNSMVAPWHQWLDRASFGRHADRVEGLGLVSVASAHGPILTGDAIGDAFDRVRDLAGAPAVTPPGQAMLDDIIAAASAQPLPA